MKKKLIAAFFMGVLLVFGYFQSGGNIRYFQLFSGDRQGNGTKIQMMTGTVSSGHVGQFDANGNLIDNGELRYSHITSDDRQGTGAKIQMTTGTVSQGHVGQFDANGNLVDNGSLRYSHIVSTDRQGSGVLLQTSSGSFTNGHVPMYTADGSLTDGGVTPTQSGIPTGAVMFFNLSSCPSGWSELISARGRYVVGLPSGGTLAGTVGTALSNNENRPVGQHTHTASGASHDHYYQMPVSYVGVSSGSSYNVPTGTGSTNTSASAVSVTVDNAGSVAGTNAPYIQLLTCQKQ
jgi:hypothetical protein